MFISSKVLLAEELLEQMYRLEKEKETDTAIEFLFEKTNDLYMEKRFDVVDSMMERLDLDEISTDLEIAFLSITFVAKDDLKNRGFFVERVKKSLRKKYEKSRTRNLLRGLE